MRYAEVAVDAPIGYGKTLSYGIAHEPDVLPGALVWVPLGTRLTQGIVFDLTNESQAETTRDIASAVAAPPLVGRAGREMARWISRHYLCSLFDAVAPMLPPGFQRRLKPWLRLNSQGQGQGQGRCDSPASGSPEALALSRLSSGREAPERDLEKALGKGGPPTIKRLLGRGLVQRSWRLSRPRPSHRYDCFVRLPLAEDGSAPPDGSLDRSPRQLALYQTLRASPQPIPLTLARKEYGGPAVRSLHEKGLLAMEWSRVDRRPGHGPSTEGGAETRPTLNADQRRALAEIEAAMDGKAGAPASFLLHGITGSGKTEVYLRALEQCVRMGKRGILLVPEISLTPQMVHRVQARFPGKVAVLHSRLAAGTAFDQWWGILDGDCQVVVGPRSALLAPLPDVGLIVVDEEHEWTYKQDAAPRYHARDAALKLGQLTGAAVILGSATPDVETYHNASRGRHRLLRLPHRIPHAGALSTGREDAQELASVRVCDMRVELKEGNRSIFSRDLARALSECVNRGEQAILFLNRRGSATVVQCRDCGLALSCRSCSVALTYHSAEPRLVCHQCNRRRAIPRVCPECQSPRIKYLGLGTQRVMDELFRTMPHVTALRWDGDTAQHPQGYDTILGRFVRGEAQVLVGTQMVAKGLHVPGVSLVGVVLADTGLNLPDFRAGERAFQLLCQVSGRAGRGPRPGSVIIQTYDPTHYAVEAAAAQDYRAFYRRELDFRREHGNPPFHRLVRMVYTHTVPEACQREAERMGRALRRRMYARGRADLDMVGPAPAFPQRVRGKYRWHLVLRGRRIHQLVETVPIPQGWTVDVDPATVM